jgi:branched-chain amino acid transport system substrate-binding protein
LVAATVFAAILAACGTNSGSNGAKTAGASCRTPGVSNGQINLGMIYPNSGTATELFTSYRAGVDARLGVENAAGGVYGRRITYSWADDASSPSTNLAAARDLVTTKNVFGILEGTAAATGSAAWLHAQGIPVAGLALEAAWSQYNNMFSYANFVTRGPSVSTWGDFMRARGATRVAVLYSPLNETSRIFRDRFIRSMQAAGLSVGEPIQASPTAVNYDSVVAQIKAQGADAVVGGMDPRTFVTAAARAQLAGAHLKVILSTSGYDQAVIQQAGKYLAGTFAVSVPEVPFEANLPAHRKYLQAMAKYAPQTQPAQTEIGLEGWLSADLLVRGLKSAGPCPTRAGFIRSLRAVKGYNADGLLPKAVSLADVFGKENVCFTFVQVARSGDRWQIIPPIPQCGSVLKN